MSLIKKQDKEIEELKWFPKDEYRWEYKDYKKASMASKGKDQSTGTEILIMNYGQ